jgi:ABC-type amino acid transport substrate-binding protein
LGWERVASWQALLPAFQRGSADLMAGAISVTAEREQSARFTSETFPTRHVVVNRAPRPPIQDLEALRQQIVGSVRGTSYLEALIGAGVPAARTRDNYAVRELNAALRDGSIGAYVVGLETAVLDRRRDPALQIGLFLGPRGRLAFGVQPGAPKLLAALDAHLAALRRTPAWNRLVVRYFGNSALEILERAGRE